MWKVIAVILLGSIVVGCGDSGFLSGVNKKVTTVTSTSVIYPSLPDIDKPLPPVLRPVVFDYPRDLSKPKEVKGTQECLQQPPIVNFDELCMQYPVLKNSNIFIGMDKKSFDNHINNQEQINSYGRILLSRIDEINKERAKWREAPDATPATK